MKEPEKANVIFEFLTLFLINIQNFSFKLHRPPFPRRNQSSLLKKFFLPRSGTSEKGLDERINYRTPVSPDCVVLYTVGKLRSQANF